MKKIIKNLIYLTLTLIFIIGVLEVNASNTPLSFSSALNTETTIINSENQDALFLIDIGLIKTDSNSIYVYDNADSTIKIIDKQTKTYKETENHYIFNNLKELLIYENTMMMLSNETNLFTCVSLTDFSPIAINQEDLETLQNAKSIEIVHFSDKDYIIICPENPIEDYFEIAELDFISGAITISNISKFAVNDDFSGQFIDMYVTTVNSELFIILQTQNQICSLTIDVNNIQPEYGNSKSITGVDPSEILNISNIEYNSSSCLAILTSSDLQLYNLNIETAIVNLEKIQDKTIDFSEYSITSSYGDNSTYVISLNQTQSLKIYDFNDQGSSFYSEFEIVNPNVSVRMFDKTEFTYHTVLRSGNILLQPFNKTTIFDTEKNQSIYLEEGTNIVVIGEGIFDNGTVVYGWNYCMYSINASNYYGYVLSSNLNELTAPEQPFNKNYVTTIAYTKLYSMPSKIVDNLNNNEIKEIPTSSRLEVLSDLNNYSSFNTNYLLVKVNNDSIGFIDRDRIIDSADTSDRVIPNATVMRNNSEIFTSTDNNKEIILTLNKGARVKVIGKRDTITNYTKVTFNDDEGNEYTGYIYTYNLEADTWSMLQIIGMFLVVLNIILLIVIICLKNKLTR